ncbi:MAG: hypothetical protein WDW38_004432 [Sanguina aurantia]
MGEVLLDEVQDNVFNRLPSVVLSLIVAIVFSEDTPARVCLLSLAKGGSEVYKYYNARMGMRWRVRCVLRCLQHPSSYVLRDAGDGSMLSYMA